MIIDENPNLNLNLWVYLKFVFSHGLKYHKFLNARLFYSFIHSFEQFRYILNYAI